MQILFKNDLIYNTLLERIQSGAYPIGFKFPPEVDFARELHVAKVTLRAALVRLEHEKLVIRIPGKGTFVANSEPLLNVCKLAVISGENPVGSPIPYMQALLNKSAGKRGIVLEHIDSTIFSTLPEKTVKSIFVAKKIEGVVMMASKFTGHEPLVMRLRALKLPVVLPHGEQGDAAKTGFATVTVDSQKAFGDTIDYVLDKGFQHVAIIGLDSNGNKACRGYSKAELTKMLGQKLHSFNYLPYNIDFVDCAIKKIYEARGQKPDVFICHSDLLAILLMAVLDKMGIKVPSQVSVVGYSGLNCDFEPGIRLTGSKYRYQEMVDTALDLITRYEDWYSPSHNYSAPELAVPIDFVEGESIRK